MALAGALTASASALPVSKSIVPGKSIGRLRIGENPVRTDGTDELDKFGPSAEGEASSGSYWRTWYSKTVDAKSDAVPAELNTYIALGSPPDTPRIQQIRVTSSYFATAGGISTKSSFAQIKKVYRSLKLVETYTTNKTNGPIQIYDDIKGGIGFEIYRGRDGKASNGLCAAIIVHSSFNATGQGYTRLSSYLKQKDANPIHLDSGARRGKILHLKH